MLQRPTRVSGSCRGSEARAASAFGPGWTARLPTSGPYLRALAGVLLCLLFSAVAHAHGVAEGDKGYIHEISGTHLVTITLRTSGEYEKIERVL